MNMSVRIMHGVFNDFFVPGIFLCGLGVLTASALFAAIRRLRIDWWLVYVALGGLAIWFWVEIAILQAFHWLHAVWGLPVIAGGVVAMSLIPARYASLAKASLVCGLLSSLFYLALCIYVPMQWPEYNSASQTISELSAIGAPTRQLWIWLCTLYTVLVTAFAWGVWISGTGSQRLRIAGGLMIAYGALGVVWPFAPMHLRQALAAGGSTFSDTIHILLGAVTEILYLLALGFAATAFGKWFRIYSLATLVLLLAFGLLTFMAAPGIAANQPTPLIGVWERVNIGLFLLWVGVLAITLLRSEPRTLDLR